MEDNQFMKSVIYKEKGVVDYSANTISIPKPGPGEVLIKVECAVINPSDLYMMQGDYAGEFSYPLTPGAEGSGTVVGYGGGWIAWSLVGKRVGFARPSEKGGKFSRGGAYAEYIVTSAMQCVTLDSKATWEQGACSFVNPLTAVGLYDKCKEYKATAVIQSGAASQLGRMIIKLFQQKGITTINIVRRQEQVELLEKEYGAQYVLNSSDQDFDKKLYELATKLHATVALECVAGDLPGRILQAMPHNSILISYGQLSEQKIGPLNPIILIFKNQRMESFLLPYWIQSKSYWSQYSAISESKKLIENITVNKSFGLHQIKEAIDFYKQNMTSGKVFLKPSLTE